MVGLFWQWVLFLGGIAILLVATGTDLTGTTG
jgi:hypothetical protein